MSPAALLILAVVGTQSKLVDATTRYRFIPMDDEVCAANALSTQSADSLTTCSYMCAKHAGCDVVTYDPQTRTCSMARTHDPRGSCGKGTKTLRKLSVEEMRCKKGWHYSSASQTCLLIRHEAVSHDSAEQVCKNHHGWLVEVKSQELNDFVVLLTSVSGSNMAGSDHFAPLGYWIGLRARHGFPGYWWMASNELVTFTNWDTGASNGGHDCVEINVSKGYRWASMPCSGLRAYVCERSPRP